MYYFIYAKNPNVEKRFTICNPQTGERGLMKVYAPRYTKEQADYVVKWMNDNNPEFLFEARKAG